MFEQRFPATLVFVDLRLPRARYRQLLAPFTLASFVVAICVVGVQFMIIDGSVAAGASVAAVLLSLVFSLWFSFLRPTIKLNGSVIRKTYIRSINYNLDTLVGVRIIGDANGGVVLQARWADKLHPLTLHLLRNDHINGMHSLSPEVLSTLAMALDVVDLRDEALIPWPKRGTAGHVEKVLKSALGGAGVEGRQDVAELLRAQAAFMEQRDTLEQSPLAAHRFTSALIAAALAAGPPIIKESSASAD